MNEIYKTRNARGFEVCKYPEVRVAGLKVKQLLDELCYGRTFIITNHRDEVKGVSNTS